MRVTVSVVCISPAVKHFVLRLIDIVSNNKTYLLAKMINNDFSVGMSIFIRIFSRGMND
jgi:hypothetical protein